MPWTIKPNAVEPRAAIDWFRSRLALTPDAYDALSVDARRRAFTVSGATSLNMVQGVFDGISKALEDGDTFEAFKKKISDQSQTAYSGSSAARLRTVFDTAAQSAYGAGRWQSADEFRVERPYAELAVVLDGRTSQICTHLQGVVLPLEELEKRSWIPPLHFRCRTALVTFSAAQAEARGITTKIPAQAPLKGFGAKPSAKEWSPAQADYHPELWAAHTRQTNIHNALQGFQNEGVKASISLEQFKIWERETPGAILNPVGFLPRTKTVYFNPQAKFWSDPTKETKRLFEDREWSSDNPNHVVWHDTAHAKYFESDAENYLFRQGRPLERDMEDLVSRYASENELEFVSEVYAALRAGRELDPKVLEYYRILEGPDAN